MQDPEYGKTVPKLILTYSEYSMQFIIPPVGPLLRVCPEVSV